VIKYYNKSSQRYTRYTLRRWRSRCGAGCGAVPSRSPVRPQRRARPLPSPAHPQRPSRSGRPCNDGAAARARADAAAAAVLARAALPPVLADAAAARTVLASVASPPVLLAEAAAAALLVVARRLSTATQSGVYRAQEQAWPGSEFRVYSRAYNKRATD
jgi:hypothetical protein